MNKYVILSRSRAVVWLLLAFTRPAASVNGITYSDDKYDAFVWNVIDHMNNPDVYFDVWRARVFPRFI